MLKKDSCFLVSSIRILILTTIFFGCSELEQSPDPEIADISVKSSVSSITYIDENDLAQKVNEAITYHYDNVPKTRTEETMTYAADTSEVRFTIDFKPYFQSYYIDPDSDNNTITITLELEDENSAAVELEADGPGNTYDLIASVLAPGYNPIEVPDCGHPEFGDHIDEIWDSDLQANVFRFYIHTIPDNDRCINFDRQRNEIKSFDKSPDNLLGTLNETVVYKWKFKLSAGFQSSPNFTHLHQLKSVGGSLASMPMYTLTTRKGNPDRLQLRYAETDSQVTLAQTALAPFIDEWLEVTEKIKYGINGTYEITIKRVNDEVVLFEYANSSIVNWRPEASFVRPKWGIYRSLLNAQDLRDEFLLFANFSIEEQ
jgi:hypothetical protein